MAKIKFGGLATDARGKIAGVVYSANRFGAYIRQKVSPTQPRTTAQTVVRERLSSLSKRWASTLTDVQRFAWSAFANVNPVRDVFGNSQQLTGINAYVKLNGIILNAGEAVIDDPPADLTLQGLLSAEVYAGSAGRTATTTTTEILANEVIFTFVAHPFLVGDLITPAGFVNVSFVNGIQLLVSAITATTVTAAFVHANVASAADAHALFSDSSVQVTFTDSPLVGEIDLYLFATQGLTAGRQFFTPFMRYIGVSPDLQASPYDATDQYLAKFGSLIAGSALGFLVAVVDGSKGAVSPGIFARTVVT